MSKYNVAYTDTCSGQANHAWVRRAVVCMPELTHYGYTGSTDGSYAKARHVYQRELMRKAKAAIGLTGARGVTSDLGELIEFRPYRSCTVMFIMFDDSPDEE